MLTASKSIFVDSVFSLTNRSVMISLFLFLFVTVILKAEQIGQHHAECELKMSNFVLTVDPSARHVAVLHGCKPVSISDTSRPLELFAFVTNRIIVESQVLTTALPTALFEVASVSFFEEKTSSSSCM